MYLLAFNLSSWPVSVVSVAIGRVSFAGYSALLDDHARLVRGFVQSIAVAVSFTLPMVLVLSFLSPDLVDVIYGAVWSEAAAPLRWLLVLGGLRVLLQLAGEVIAVVGRTGTVLRLRLFWLLLLPLTLDYGAEHAGLRGVGIAHVTVATVVMVPLFLWEIRRSGIPLKPLASVLPRPVAAGVAALVAMVVLERYVDQQAARLLIVGGTGGLVYLAALVPANKVVMQTWHQLRGTSGSAGGLA